MIPQYAEICGRDDEVVKRYKSGRILVVEDSFIIALDIAETLQAAGHTPVGPASSLAEAFELIHNNKFDAAVLDVSLEGEKVFPAARLLQARAVPFLFFTAYNDGDAAPPEFKDAVYLQKPLNGDLMLQRLSDLLEPSAPQNARLRVL